MMTHKERLDRRDRMLAMRAEGMTYREIGEAFGVSRARAHAIITRPPRRKYGRPAAKFTAEEIAAAVAEYEAGSSSAVVARLLGVAPTTAIRLLRAAGVEIRLAAGNLAAPVPALAVAIDPESAPK